MQYRFYKQLTEVFYRPADSYIIDRATPTKSRIFGEVDDLWSTVNKDYHLKESICMKNPKCSLTGSYPYWLFFYHKQFPACKKNFLFFKIFQGLNLI